MMGALELCLEGSISRNFMDPNVSRAHCSSRDDAVSNSVAMQVVTFLATPANIAPPWRMDGRRRRAECIDAGHRAGEDPIAAGARFGGFRRYHADGRTTRRWSRHGRHRRRVDHCAL